MNEPFLIKILYIAIKILIIFIDTIGNILYFILYRNYKSEKLHPIKNRLLIESATSLGWKIRNRKITSEEITRVYIDRIRIINPLINAVVDDRFDNAIREAKTADEYLKNNPDVRNDLEKEKPFFGVPMTIKESFKVTGLHNTSGVYYRKDDIATEDAACVRLMKKAGVIILAVTNVPEICMAWDTYNSIYGQTKNPYNFSRIAGGSSGGEGAIISACGSPMGLGSDIGGSVRIPAFFNGIFAHKTTTGIIDNSGQEPNFSDSPLDMYLSSGPLCRYACDLKPMLKVFADSNVDKLSLERKVDFKNLKIYYMEDDNGNPFTTAVDDELKGAIKRTAEYFKTTYNITCQKLDLVLLRRTTEMYFSKVVGTSSENSFAKIMAGKRGEINVWLETVKCLIGQSRHTLPLLVAAIMQKFPYWYSTPTIKKLGSKDFEDLKIFFSEKFTGNEVFLFPPNPNEAPYIGQTLFKFFNPMYTGIFNLLGLPVTVCPVGLNSNGLPYGVQVVAGKYQDYLCLAVAEEIEKAFGGWVCPSDIQA